MTFENGTCGVSIPPAIQTCNSENCPKGAVLPFGENAGGPVDLDAGDVGRRGRGGGRAVRRIVSDRAIHRDVVSMLRQVDGLDVCRALPKD